MSQFSHDILTFRLFKVAIFMNILYRETESRAHCINVSFICPFYCLFQANKYTYD